MKIPTHWLAGVVLISLLTACATSDGTAMDPATPASSSTSLSTGTEPVPTSTSTTSTSTTSTTASPRTETTEALVDETTTTTTTVYVVTGDGHPAPLPGSSGWFGSGCSPGTDALPDGIWWGYLDAFDEATVAFDLACIRFDSDDDPTTDGTTWVFENRNPRLRVITVSPTALVHCDWMFCPPHPFPYSDWIGDSRLPHGNGGPEVGVWLYVNDGIVTEIDDEVVAG